MRLLPIYGHSGSGKSSLARAGLIPALAQRPLPGYAQARVAVLVPGTHPNEALASVLARVATVDPTPVAKTREFAGELKQVNADGAYDGLRRIADILPDIAISPLIGLVDQKDTRRRTEIQKVISQQDNLEQVKQVIARFSSPGAKLITLAANANAETAEVTHEALFDHWQLLNNWLDSSRSDLRFERRLDEAIRYWEEQSRPEGNLWRPPDLDLLKRYHQRLGEQMTRLQMEFFNASLEAVEKAQKERKRRHMAAKAIACLAN